VNPKQKNVVLVDKIWRVYTAHEEKQLHIVALACFIDEERVDVIDFPAQL
jgi:hypothetical protein